MSKPIISSAQSPMQGQSQSQNPAGHANALEYRNISGLLDDACTEDGRVKPQWQYLLNSLRNLGPDKVHERELKARRILRDDGATYNIYSGEEGRPSSDWELDPVPYIIVSDDWANIEAGLLERSELFNLLLRDLYGPRTLLRYGVIPPEALFSHGGFLRACQGIQLPGEHELIVHAVDMVRQNDGSMCVLSDRTQAPSGAGYALENRTVMSRVFPSIFRDSHVHRLASFYQHLRLKLIELSPFDEEPLVTVLTPGSQNESYFEHAYLANYLGFPLVQSGDLVVRNGFLWMKSLDGLKRVDVVMRHVDDSFCDPVELRGDSQLGVPGLLEVVRSGRVAIANPLGSGVLENPILLKYLPEISRSLLGREPRLASVKTFWCGDDKDLEYINANIRDLIIKPAYRGTGINGVWGGDLSEQQTTALLAAIAKNRYQYVAQKRLEKTHIPTFAQGKLEPRPALLRTFSTATDSSYKVLPGGLTRIGNKPQERFIGMQSGSTSKDTWITATEPQRTADTGVTTEVIHAGSQTAQLSLPSRVVENLYWMGRYAERAEASLRLLRTVFVLLNSENTIGPTAKRILLQTVTRITATLPGFMVESEELLANPDEELLQIIKDGSRAGSIKSTLTSMLACAEESKELLSSDTMRVINDLRDALLEFDMTQASDLASAPEEALDPMVTALAALSGLMQESMIRSVGWRFMELGKRIERAQQIINTLRGLLTPVTTEGDQATLMSALLISMDVLITYRRRSRERRGIELALDLVMMESNNPRSLIFQLERLQQHVAELPATDGRTAELEGEERALLEAMTSLKLSRLSTLLETANQQREGLDKLLEKVDELLKNFNGFISDRHFDHRTDSQQLVNSMLGTP